MYIYALKMLTGDRVKYIGLIVGIAFSTMLICQQASILSGLIIKTSSFIDEFDHYNVWVFNPSARFTEDAFLVGKGSLWEIKSIDGVQESIGIYKRPIQVKTNDAHQSGILVGFTDGRSPHDIPRHLLQEGLVVEKKPIKIKEGDEVSIEQSKIKISGTYPAISRFFWEPVFYTDHFNITSSLGIDGFTFVAVRTSDPERVIKEIKNKTGLVAMSSKEFSRMNSDYVMRETGIVTNFAIAVFLGFIIGVIVTGQTFYNFTLDNIKYYGAMKAMGVNHFTLSIMVIIQSLVAALIGFGVGLGCAKLCGIVILKMGLAFDLNALIALSCLGAILLVSLFSAVMSLQRVFKVDPAIVFKN